VLPKVIKQILPAKDLWWEGPGMQTGLQIVVFGLVVQHLIKPFSLVNSSPLVNLKFETNFPTACL
jgi:hypothetical protein